MILPMKIFTYLFRPLIFEVNSIFSLAAAIDNLIILYLMISGGKILIKKNINVVGENRLFMWVYSILVLLILASTTANLGIALRQKWMFMPMLIFLFISAINLHKPSRAI